MSLAFYASPIHEDLPYQNQNSNKKSAFNKTQKRFIGTSSLSASNPKVNYVLNKMNRYKDPAPSSYESNNNFIIDDIYENDNDYDNDYDNDNNSLGDFNPPDNPISIGAMRTEDTNESFKHSQHVVGKEGFYGLAQGQGQEQSMESKSNLDLNFVSNNYTNPQQTHEYYKKIIPNYNPKPLESSSSSSSSSSSLTDDILLKKLNYVIRLLEEQKDEKTNNVTEEVILYCFLGIFIIFIVDSFARVGKYVR